ncbi:hypothetical protein EVAR_83241_1 [Eumeta japonica]|uniref:Uncharacterized protein n=1 Tax=Eumeta variegata TaxID=151549 RepID=A0A4C1Y3I5_EUMVA|nr:hypothetical protein EVAR_83241_1 [Eumeta japonica]
MRWTTFSGSPSATTREVARCGRERKRLQEETSRRDKALTFECAGAAAGARAGPRGPVYISCGADFSVRCDDRAAGRRHGLNDVNVFDVNKVPTLDLSVGIRIESRIDVEVLFGISVEGSHGLCEPDAELNRSHSAGDHRTD